jgi:uncharacterized protein YbjT (DUF2867 family)
MKKYVITGSLGNISKPIIIGLAKAGHDVHVITSSADRQAAITQLGAKAHVGRLQDQAFLNGVLAGADAVYTMIPPIWQTTDWRASQRVFATAYAEAITANNIQYVVNLSSVGAHAPNGVGPVSGLYDFEQLLNQISGLHSKHLRPSFFFNNLMAQIPLIKQAGIMGSNYGHGEKLFLVHTDDIAAVALEELLALSFKGSGVRYIIGDERSGQGIADVLGKAIGKPLAWMEFTDEQQHQGLVQAGLPQTIADGYTEMGHAIRTGLMQYDVRQNLPVFSPTKLETFAHAFAIAYKG